MEELTSILGLVVAAGILLAKSAIRTKAAKAAKKHDVGSSDEAWPAWNPEPASASRKQSQKNDRPEPAREKSVFQPVVQKATAARRDNDRSRKRKQPAASAQAARVQPAADATETAHTSKNVLHGKTGGTEGFDLRQAVIASEILRPKFDE
ncbi:MAG: hypothetical protein NC209_00135 [Alistipes sp.]|nr:hypothetical protein [Alistipes senegalensis]MCM1249540.1 hypothetical protein [Alistipes sp.]